MFTDGNIKDLNVAFLPPEDRQTFKANVIYRDEKENGFPENKSTVIRLHGTEYNDDPLETFDLSGFCTSKKHARNFGKYILATRKFVDHTITFKTAPHYINGVQPGDYIRVFSTTQHVQRFNNGAILDDGSVVSKETISGSKTFYYWNPSEEVVKEATENFSNPLPTTYRGSLFTIKESEASDQCYKVESITFGEDGLIELSGSFTELDGNKLAMLQRWDDTNVNNPLFDYDLE
jgi:predicted phage tail protein